MKNPGGPRERCTVLVLFGSQGREVPHLKSLLSLKLAASTMLFPISLAVDLCDLPHKFFAVQMQLSNYIHSLQHLLLFQSSTSAITNPLFDTKETLP